MSFTLNGAPADGDTFTIAPNAGLGDTRNASLMGDLQSTNVMDGGKATFQSAYATLVSTIGNKTREVQANAEAAAAQLTQAQSAANNVWGVNLGRGGGRPPQIPAGLPGIGQGDADRRHDFQCLAANRQLKRSHAMTLRISTNAIFQAGTTQINTLQSQMAKTQMQLSTNKRMLTAADDPIGSAKALKLTQSQSMNTQFGTNRTNASSSLSMVDKTLQDVTGQITDIQSLIITAGDAGYSDSDRAALATELEGRMADLLGSANTTDGTGTYLFSGYKTTTQPFTQTPTGATYQGDQGQRTLQVGSTRWPSAKAAAPSSKPISPATARSSPRPRRQHRLGHHRPRRRDGHRPLTRATTIRSPSRSRARRPRRRTR